MEDKSPHSDIHSLLEQLRYILLIYQTEQQESEQLSQLVLQKYKEKNEKQDTKTSLDRSNLRS